MLLPCIVLGACEAYVLRRGLVSTDTLERLTRVRYCDFIMRWRAREN